MKERKGERRSKHRVEGNEEDEEPRKRTRGVGDREVED